MKDQLQRSACACHCRRPFVLTDPYVSELQDFEAGWQSVKSRREQAKLSWGKTLNSKMLQSVYKATGWADGATFTQQMDEYGVCICMCYIQ